MVDQMKTGVMTFGGMDDKKATINLMPGWRLGIVKPASCE